MSMEKMHRAQIERAMVSRPVRSLQYMLRRLSKRYTFLPEVVPDGYFGDRTLEAVMLFQKYFLPPVNGVVDQRTWTAIRDRWVAMERELSLPRQLRGFPRGTQVEIGESAEVLYLVQAMFQSLSRVIEGVEEEVMDGIQNGSSVANTLWLQHRAGLPATGAVDQQTWNVLTRLYEMFVVRPPQQVNRKVLLPGRG